MIRAIVAARLSSPATSGHRRFSGQEAIHGQSPSRRTLRSGGVVPELGDQSIHEVIHGNYRIVYRFRDDVIEIVRCFIVAAYSRSTEPHDTRASNFPINQTAALRCSATAGYRVMLLRSTVPQRRGIWKELHSGRH